MTWQGHILLSFHVSKNSSMSSLSSSVKTTSQQFSCVCLILMLGISQDIPEEPAICSLTRCSILSFPCYCFCLYSLFTHASTNNDHKSHLLLSIVFSLIFRSVVSMFSSQKLIQNMLGSTWTLTSLPPSVRIPYPLVMEFQTVLEFILLMICDSSSTWLLFNHFTLFFREVNVN